MLGRILGAFTVHFHRPSAAEIWPSCFLGVVLVFILGAFTEILGMALGWVWGVISQKAALATRPAAETSAKLQALVQQVQSTGTPATNLIFEGFFLDTRVIVTFFCMLGLFIYLMVRRDYLSSCFKPHVLIGYRLDYVKSCPSSPLLQSLLGSFPTYG